MNIVKYTATATLCLIILCTLTVLSAQNNQDTATILTNQEMNSVVDFADKATQYIADHDMYQACISFKNDPQWQLNNTQILIFDEHDIVWLCTHDDDLIWDKSSLQTLTTAENVSLIKIAREKGNRGDWVNFLMWQNDITNGYFKNFTKDNRKFTLGILVFPQNETHEVAKLVLSAYQSFTNNGLQQTIDAINKLVGPFIEGSLSVSLYNENGICLADSYDMTRVNLGSDLWFDDAKKNVFEAYKAATDNARNFGWSINTFGGQKKKTLVLKAQDIVSGKYYYFASGYYTEFSDAYVIHMAQRVKKTLLKEGVKIFDNPSTLGTANQTTRLNVVIYNDKGFLQLNTRYPSLRGLSLIDHQDHAGNYVTKELVSKILTDGKGWVFSYLFNAVQPIYGEKVVLPEGTFIVTIQGYTPVDKKNIIANRAEVICRIMLDHPFKKMLNVLNLHDTLDDVSFESWNHAGFFYRLYDNEGYCLSAGPNHLKIWNKADKEIFGFIKKLNQTKKEGNWFSYKRKNKKYSIFLKKCNKSETEKYFIVVGYYTITTKGS